MRARSCGGLSEDEKSQSKRGQDTSGVLSWIKVSKHSLGLTVKQLLKEVKEW